jgi:hypothetical protein
MIQDGQNVSLEKGGLLSFLQGLQLWLSCSGGNFFPVHVTGMELNLFSVPDDAFHVSSFDGQDPIVLKLDIMTHICTVLSSG